MKWVRDPFVLGGAVVAFAVTAWALFAGRYYPGIDWSNHLALIAILTDGDKSGATQYFVRSLLPTPYLLFYFISAFFGQFMPVDAAAKLVIALAGGFWVIAAAHLAEATGRNPRLGLFAPLALFSVSMGWGFGSFVFTSPLLFFALGSAERMFASPRSPKRIAEAAGAVLLVYLGHGLLIATLVLLLGVRALALSIFRRSPRPLLELALAGVPTGLVSLPAVLSWAKNPWIEAGAKSVFDFPPLKDRLNGLGGNLLERGSPEHWTVMWVAVAVYAALLIYSFVRRTTSTERSLGLETYAAVLTTFYLFGPMTLGTVWFVYPRYAALAAVAILLLPRVDLRGRIGAAICVVALALVAWNASINRRHVIQFYEWAKPFDRVRELIPPGSKVLPLTVVGGGDRANYHHALGSLYFYVMVDGASYVPFVFDNPGHPVYHRKDLKHPRAPFWRSPDSYDPRVHGIDYDYLILRGQGLIQRTQAAGLHELLENVEGWAVFRTKKG
jgi:hypothetical protein